MILEFKTNDADYQIEEKKGLVYITKYTNPQFITMDTLEFAEYIEGVIIQKKQ